MKLLFDENISFRLVEFVADIYPGSSHTNEHHFQKTDDERIWNFAQENGFVIVSKDSDFLQRSSLFGFPPKVIWLRLGNCTTKDVVKILRTYQDEIYDFSNDERASFLAIP